MTDTPTPPMMLEQRAGLVDWLRHPCAETPYVDANDMADAADHGHEQVFNAHLQAEG